MGRLTEPGRVGEVVAAFNKLIEDEPLIRSGSVRAGLRLAEDLIAHAHYSWAFDFNDEPAWRAYTAGLAHAECAAVVTPLYESAIMTEYEV
jgi:hypothetical protein